MSKKELVKEYANNHRYFTLSQIARNTKLGRKILMDYLLQFKKEKLVFDAGYGCYSSISKAFTLPGSSRVKNIVKFIKKEFPLLEEFVVWDTQELQSFYHHMQTHHITFVEVDKEALNSVYNSIYSKFQNVLKEYRSNSFYKAFDIAREPVIVRGLISRSLHYGPVPALEKILIDMLMDLNRYNYLGGSDYLEIWRDLIQGYRLNVRAIHSYGKRRKCLKLLYLQLALIKEGYGIEFCRLLQEVGKSL